MHILANSMLGFAINRPHPVQVKTVPVNNITTAQRTWSLSEDYCIYSLGQESVLPRYYGAFTNQSKTARLLTTFHNPKYCPNDNYPEYNNTVHTPHSNPYLLQNKQRANISISEINNCTGLDIACFVSELEDRCFLVFRLEPGIILAACLFVKASYMTSILVRSRNKRKTQCLTFGDVLVASKLQSIHLKNESMLNAGDIHRRRVRHQCHKHCKSKLSSDTGEEVGRCQKCRKPNKVSNVTDLVAPVLAIKRKKSLISTLGQTALTQMMTLSFCSVCALSISLLILNYMLGYSATLFAASDDWVGALTQVYFELGEFGVMCIANGPQLLYSTLYLLLVYDITLINMESEWGKIEKTGARLRCTLVKGKQFDQSYFLQLPKKIIFPMMAFSIITHLLLALAIQAEEEAVDWINERHSNFTIRSSLYSGDYFA